MIKQLQQLADSCRSSAEYYKGSEVAYELEGIAEQIEKIIKPPPSNHIIDLAKRIIDTIPPGRYKSWGGGHNNPNSIAGMVGCLHYNRLLEALAILKKEGWVYKIKKDGTPSSKGQWWVINKKPNPPE